MKTILLEAPGQFAAIETDAPGEPGPGEARIRVHRVGICGTDLHAFRGRQPFFSYPRILGHELGVEVVAVGEGVSNVAMGDTCSVEPYLHCGTCIACRRGRTNCCTSLQVLGVHIDGGMREEIVVPADKLYKSSQLTTDQLALVETLGIGAHAVDRAQPERGETVLVIGAGPIGLGVTQFSLIAGAEVILLEPNPDRAKFCGDHFGIKAAITSLDDVPAALEAENGGDLPTAVFDATGNPASMQAAFGYVASGGRLTLVGIVQGEITFSDPEFHRRETTLLASRNSRPDDFRRIIDLMERGEVNTDPWITHRSGYDGFGKVFPTWLEPSEGVVKAVLEL